MVFGKSSVASLLAIRACHLSYSGAYAISGCLGGAGAAAVFVVTEAVTVVVLRDFFSIREYENKLIFRFLNSNYK